MLRSSLILCSRRICAVDNLLKINNTCLPKGYKELERMIPALRYSTNADKIDSRFSTPEKIYHGVLTPQIRAVKIFSLTSSIAGLIAQPIIYEKASEIGGTSVVLALGAIVGFFTFVTPLLLHFITKKYVTEIHYDVGNQTYTATTLSFFVTKKKLKFQPSDVDMPDIPGMFTSFTIKGKPVFIELKHFTDPIHYSKIMGYDKPIDFKMENINIPTEDNKKLQ